MIATDKYEDFGNHEHVQIAGVWYNALTDTRAIEYILVSRNECLYKRRKTTPNKNLFDLFCPILYLFNELSN